MASPVQPSTKRLHLTDADRKQLGFLLRNRPQPVRLLKRVRILELLDAGASIRAAKEQVGVAETTVRRVACRYRTGGLGSAIHDRLRPGRKAALNTAAAAQILALVAGPPPSGHERWSVRLVAAEAVRRAIVASIGRETIRRLLREHGRTPQRA